MTYAKFFARPDLVEQYRAAYRQATPPPYRASKLPNWEAQHPPLYYIVMAPLQAIAGQSSFLTGMLLLRAASFAMALGGVALGLLAVERSAPNVAGDAVIGFLIYPLVLPMFFPEFARVGNDSLCLLLAGATAFLLSTWLNDDSDARISLALGVVLGLGLLTKALFVPVFVALLCFIVLRRFGKDTASRTPVLRNIALIFAPAILLGAGWYAYSVHISGSFVMSADSIALAHAGGLVAGLTQKFSLVTLLRGLVVPPVSYLWAGSWSLARLPALLQIPMLILAFSCFAAFILQIRNRATPDRAWLPIWLFGAFAVGILYHVLVSMAAYGHGNTPGWYFHIAMPWVAPALGIGACALLRRPRTRTFIVGLLSYAVLFQIVAVWAEFSLFTGCATKAEDKSYAFPGHALCLDQFPLMADRLAVLGWPVLAVAGFGGGLICALVLWEVQRRSAANNRLVIRNHPPTTLTRAGIH